MSLHTTDTRPEEERLTVLFNTDNPEELEALHYWRAAFAESADLEPVLDDRIWALHISPGLTR